MACNRFLFLVATIFFSRMVVADELVDTAPAPETARQFLQAYQASSETIPLMPHASVPDQWRDLNMRQPLTLNDQLSVAPGLLVLQEGPGGEANSMFWRGHDVIRGSGINFLVDDVPINLPGFRQHGEADLHWLMPELVDSVEALPGPYFVQSGDFGSAGQIQITTRKSLPNQSASLQSGIDSTIRAAVVSSLPQSNFSPVLAGEFYTLNYPAPSPNQLSRYNLFGEVSYSLTAHSGINLGATAYHSNWNSAGLIPSRAVNAGALPFNGAIDGNQNAEMQRYSLHATYHVQPNRDSSASVTTFVTRARALAANDETYFLNNPRAGDLIQDSEQIWQTGASAKYKFSEKGSGLSFDTEFGLQTSVDWSESNLGNSNTGLNTFGKRGALYAQQRGGWGKWFQTLAGVRGDYLSFSARGVALDKEALLLSPKAALIITPTKNTEFFVDTGASFESNDPRAIALVPATLVASRITQYELGMRTALFNQSLHFSASGFLSSNEPTTLYSADTGVTTPIGSNTRIGAEVGARYEIISWLLLDTDATFTRARLDGQPDGNNLVPLAPTRVLTAGLTAHHPKGYYGRLGLVQVGNRPASSDGYFTAQGFTRFDASLGYENRDFKISLAVINLLNTQWKEIQTAGVSRLPSETSAASCPAGARPVSSGGSFAGCEDLLFSAGTPLNVQASATVFF